MTAKEKDHRFKISSHKTWVIFHQGRAKLARLNGDADKEANHNRVIDEHNEYIKAHELALREV